MATYLKYGSYTHEENELTISISKNTLFDSSGVPYAVIQNWNIEGWLFGDDSSDLTSKIRALETAYSEHGKDLEFFINSAKSAHTIKSSETVGGIKVINPPHYSKGEGAEYSTFRTYSITLEAEIPLDNNREDGDTISFNESLQFVGGGPRFVYLQTINGKPQKQQVAQSTPYKCVQTGSAVGYKGYPVAPPPMFPGDEHIDQRNITRKSPKKRGTGNQYTDYEISWTYNFESANKFGANPNKWT